jgi:hypothetical protein
LNLVVAALHAETRGDVSVRKIEGVAGLLASASGGDSCEQALGFARRRYTRNSLAALLLADDIVGGLRGGVEGVDRMGQGYRTEPLAPGCELLLPPDDPGRQQGAVFARYWRATASRPSPGRRVKAVVLHVTNGSLSSAVASFQGHQARTSAHYVVRASDGLVVQMVDEGAVAFHDACFNEESIGIEHEGETRDGRRWFSEAQYRASARLVRDIAARHGLPLDRAHVLGHSEAPDCSDHDDPGPSWDWERYWRMVVEAESPRGG